MADQNQPQLLNSPLEPALKKTKMSSTSDSDSTTTVHTTDATAPRRYKRRKIAILFAYCGVGYQGMQKNPGAKTIEGDLEEALYLAGAVPADERGQHKKYDWARSARTDKGVSAIGQVVSGKFFVDPPGLIERLNSFLSPQIRVFGFKRVTPSFSAKKFCDRRRYVYLLPVFALDSSCHRDRESVMQSLGSGEELVKCGECSERGRKVVGVMGNYKRDVLRLGISSNSCSALGVVDGGEVEVEEKNGQVLMVGVEEKEEGNVDCVETGVVEDREALMVDVENTVDKKEGNVGLEKDFCVEGGLESEVSVVEGEVSGKPSVLLDDEKAKEEKRVKVSVGTENVAMGDRLKNEVLVPCGNSLNGGAASLLATEVKEHEESNVLNGVNGVGDLETNEEEKKEKSEFKYGDEVRERFNRILKYYVGTHNFHNFTTRTKAEDPSAKRYILSFEANTTLTIEGIEFVKCEVVGQSFMLHQIRKMMGMAVAVMRNFAPESIYDTAFDQVVKINVPTAPEVGLYLDECMFTSYNNKWHETHEEVSVKAYAEEAEEFKLKHIHSHIANTEHKEGTVAVWLHSLNRRNYPDLCPSEEGAELAAEADANNVLP